MPDIFRHFMKCFTSRIACNIYTSGGVYVPCMPGESDHRRLRSLLLCLCYVFGSLINSLVCWFCTGTLGLVLFQILTFCLLVLHWISSIFLLKYFFVLGKVIWWKGEDERTERERQRETETDRQTDRQTERERLNRGSNPYWFYV